MIKKIAYFISIIFIISCKSDDGMPDCSAVLCAEPAISINLIDTDTNLNIILQDNISKEMVVIKNASKNEMPFSIFESNGFLYVEKQNRLDSLEIQINSEIVATISYDTTEPNPDECCDFGSLINVVIEGLSYTIENHLVTIYL